MSDIGTTSFDNSEKIDILIKENFNVSSTNENTPWYLENNVAFNTYINGKDVLLDEIPNSIDWTNSSFLSEQDLLSIYGLNNSDFYTGGGVKVDSTGILHKFIKLKLQPIPGTIVTSGTTTTYFSYYFKNSDGVNLLENSFQLNNGDGSSFEYALYSEDNIANNVSILQDSNGGNWFFNFKNGVVFVPDPINSLTMLNQVNQNKLPYFTFVKYVGRKGIIKQISIVQDKTTILNPENNQLVVQKSDDTIHRYDSSSGNWISVGGSGGGTTSILSLNDVNDVNVTTKNHGDVLKWNSINNKWENSNSFSYNNLTEKPYIPKFTNDITNNSGFVTQSHIDTSIANLVDSAPAALNTLNELAAALGDDENFSTTVNNEISKKLSITDASSTYATKNDVNLSLNLKQDTLTAGQNIVITNNTISAEIPVIETLNDISNVDVTTKNDGEVLKWNEEQQKWISDVVGTGNGVTVIPPSAEDTLKENINYPTANTGTGKEGDIIYDASENLFYEASNSKTDIIGNGDVQFRPLGYSFFAKNMEGQAPNVQSTSFFFFELTPSSIILQWTNPIQYETGITASLSQELNETAPIVSQPSNDVGGKINFPVVNRIMLQIKNLETGQYITWGTKRSPISQNVTGLTGGYVICSKDYPIPPMNTNRNFGNVLADGGRSTAVYKLDDFANSIVLYSQGNTPTNDIIKNNISSYPKRVIPVSGETIKELNKSVNGYEIKFWYENEYKVNPNSNVIDGWGMTENDFNVVTLTQAKDLSGNLILDNGQINFLSVDAPSEAIDTNCSIVFNDLGNVSDANTIIEIAVKDPELTTSTNIEYNTSINLTEIKFEYRNNTTSGITDVWVNVKKIFDNITRANSNSDLSSKTTLTNGIYSINRKRDDNYRYFYVEVNNDMLGVTNNDVEKYLSFRVSYKNASVDEFGNTKNTNELIFDRPAKPTISSVVMSRSDQLDITIANMTDNDKISNLSVNNNNGVFLRTIDLIASYEMDDGNIIEYNTQFTSTNVSDNDYYHSNTQNSNTTYIFNLPNTINATNSLKWNFQIRVKNNLINEWSEISDTAISNSDINESSNNAIKISTVSSNNSLTNIKFNNLSDRNNGIIQLNWNDPVAGDRGVITSKLKNNTDQNPKIKDYNVSIFRPDVTTSQIVKTFTNTQSNRTSDATNNRLYDDIFSIIDQNGISTNASGNGLGNTNSSEKEIKVLVKQRNEYVTTQTDIFGSIFYDLGAPNPPNTNTNTSLINYENNNTITLKWSKNTTTGFQTRELINSTLVTNLTNKEVGIINYRVNISANVPESKSPYYRLDGGKFTTAPTAPKTITNINKSNSSEAVTYLSGSDGIIDKSDSWTGSTGAVGDVLVFPETTYTFNIWSKNVFNIESSTSRTITINTGSPPSINSQLTTSTIPINTTYDDIRNLSNYTYQNKGFLLSDTIDEKPSTIKLYQITKANNFPSFSANQIHRINKNKFNDFLVDNDTDRNPTEYVKLNEDLNNKKLRQFRIANIGNVIYTFGSNSNFNNVNDVSTGTALEDMISISSTNVKDEYNDSPQDPNNKGYWWKETMEYTINIDDTKNTLYKNPIKLTLEARYNNLLDSNTNWMSSSLDIDNNVVSVSKIIFQNTENSIDNNVIYFDKLNTTPSATKDETTDMITYTTNNYINGIPNLYIIDSNSSYSYNIALTYKLTNFSEYYGLNNSLNFLEHTLISNTGSNVSIKKIEPRNWDSKANCERSNSGWRISNLNITSSSGTDVTNKNVGSSSETGSHADVRLQLNLKNTFGTSNFNVNNTHSDVYRFIYDKTSVDLINELKNASEASHSTSSASLTTQNGQIMEVPSNFNPHELNSAITQGVDFTDSVFNEFKSSYNSKQLILFDGKFSTAKYLSDSYSILYNALHNNKHTYGIAETFKTNSDTSYSWVIYKFIRKYTGSGSQNLNWFVLNFNENTNISSSDLENGDAQIWIQTKLTEDGVNYTTHTYTANPGDNAPGVLRWIKYTPSGANTTQSVTATLGAGANLGANNGVSSFDKNGDVGSSGINISGTAYSSRKRNLVGVINNVNKINNSGNIVYYISVGLKNNKSLWISKPDSFDAFLPDKTISR